MRRPREWTTPAAVTDHVRRLWENGKILRARLSGERLFPLAVPLTRADVQAVSDRFQDVRDWIRTLEAGSRAKRGFGYDIEWVERSFQRVGRNRFPQGIIVPTEGDALRMIGQQRAGDRFQDLAVATLAAFPALKDWLAKKPLAVLEEADDWPRILSVLAWFRDHPRPGLYLRQVDIAGVDTKFIEARTALLSELLDRILPGDPGGATASHDPSEPAIRRFERRYGLRSKPTTVRFRILDDRHRIGGLSDLAVSVSELALLKAPISRVFITENVVNGLAFPEIDDSLVIFGLGYGVEVLAPVEWLQTCAVYYWGDIDTHGFRILDWLRGVFPEVHSFLMDEATLLAHRGLIVSEKDPFTGGLTRLTEDERSVYSGLRQNRWGEHVRLEQERIAYGWWRRAVDAVAAERRSAVRMSLP
jgi:hypothetical protein